VLQHYCAHAPKCQIAKKLERFCKRLFSPAQNNTNIML
jgi:hypothetical protein